MELDKKWSMRLTPTIFDLAEISTVDFLTSLPQCRIPITHPD